MLLGSLVSYRNGFLGAILLLTAGWCGLECATQKTLFGQERALPLPPRLPGTGNGAPSVATPSQTLPAIPNRQLPNANGGIENPGSTNGQNLGSVPGSNSTIYPVSNSQPNSNLRSPAEQTNNGLRLFPCTVMVIEKVELPAREAGVLSLLNAREGQLVTGGSIIAKVDDSLAATELESAKRRLEASQLKVSSDIAIQYANAERETAWKAFKREDSLAKQGHGVAAKREELHLTAVQADLKVEKANHDFQVDQKAIKLDEIQVAKAQQTLDRYTIVAPWSGVVRKTLKRQSEWVNAGDPILEMVQMDRIWIEGMIDPKTIHPYQVSGKAAIVKLKLAGGEIASFDGQITFVDPQVVGDSRKVRAEVLNRQFENHWLLAPGMEVEMEILLNESPVDRVSQQ